MVISINVTDMDARSALKQCGFALRSQPGYRFGRVGAKLVGVRTDNGQKIVDYEIRDLGKK